MALSDSMFLFEIDIKSLKSFIAKEFQIDIEFSNVFNLTIANSINTLFKQTRRLKQKCKIRKKNIPIKKCSNNTLTRITVKKEPFVLLSNMQKYPLHLLVFHTNKVNGLKPKLGSTTIPWAEVLINYISGIKKNTKASPPAYTEGTYNVYDKTNSKCIITLKMSVKITYMNNKVPFQIKSSNITLKQSLIHESHANENTNLSSSDFKKYFTNKNILPITSLQSVATVRSDTKLISNECKILKKSQSSSSVGIKGNETLKYIFGDPLGHYGNQVYYVGYFSVEKDASHPNSTKSEDDVERSKERRKKFKFIKCDIECPGKKTLASSSNSTYSLDIIGESDQVTVTKCNEIDCDNRNHRVLPPRPMDESIFLDLGNLKKDCCVTTKTEEKIEEVFGGVKAKMKIGEDPCFCTCECTFGFTKRTTYCNVCGGYELAGDDLSRKPIHQMPMPCPLYHKMIDKNKLKTWSTSGSESRKKADDQKNLKTSSSQKTAVPDKRFVVSEKKSVESEKDSKKSKKKKTDERFKFNYGYKGIPPQIGHSKCALPCSGTLDNVPKNMGWLWTAENVPGIKFRPLWKPGATSKHVVRLLKIARNPGEMISKKKRKDTSKKKRPIKRPLLIVHKKDGEFTITMETMKNYSKPRAINQQPYEDKPVITYTIGRTEEENRVRLKKKERERRRLERAQREFIQSTFRNMCHEICLKTYQQALGILPDAEDPTCICYPAIPTPKTTNMNLSCSCSEDSVSIGSDTDSDEWIIEFTPPNALFDPSHKGKKVLKTDNGTQYTYLDYRLKLVDRFGNPVPRFFKGPDGKQQCSDLGGFWSPEHKWLEINIDGYIAPDGRWAPNIFKGPNGEQVDAETGKFQAMNGKWLIVGVDGYIDSQGNWKNYPNSGGKLKKRRRMNENKKGKPGDKKYDKSETSWSCLGDVSPKELSKLGIVGHGEDRKLLITTLQDLLARGEDVNIPQPKTVFHLPSPKKSKLYRKENIKHGVDIRDFGECQHALPSDKGVVAVDAYGNKIYFKLKSRRNVRPKERLAIIADQGISLSSFHVPCFHSFINSEVMKQQQRKRLLALAGKSIATQVT